MIVVYMYAPFICMYMLHAGEAEQGGRRGNCPSNNTFGAPPIVLLEGHCPLKNNQSCDAVLYLNFVV